MLKRCHGQMLNEYNAKGSRPESSSGRAPDHSRVMILIVADPLIASSQNKQLVCIGLNQRQTFLVAQPRLAMLRSGFRKWAPHRFPPIQEDSSDEGLSHHTFYRRSFDRDLLVGTSSTQGRQALCRRLS
jgi:hypothetical protein